MTGGKAGNGDPEVGARIRAIRKSKHWTLKDLASKSNFDQPNLSKLEHGQVGFSIESLKRIAKALDVPISELFRSEFPGPVFWVPFINDPERPMFPSGHTVSGAPFALEVSDEALAPLIHRGDIVICTPIPWSEGRAVVAKHGNDFFVRKVRTLVPAKWADPQIQHNADGEPEEVWVLKQDAVYELYADNDMFPPIRVPHGDSEYRILGPVVQRITQMLRIPRTVFASGGQAPLPMSSASSSSTTD